MDDLPCPCCGFLTLKCEYGSYDICQICGWEDDAVQLANPTSEGGANLDSLAQAQAFFLKKYPPTVQFTDGVRRGFGWRPLDANDIEVADTHRVVQHWHTVAVRWESETYWSGPRATGQELPPDKRDIAISNLVEKMNDEFSYVWLLPLLEKPFETAALDLPDAVRALGKKYTLPTEIALQPLVITALTSQSEYWAGLALKWLEDGFPIDFELTGLLAHCAENQTLSQSRRHRARRLAYRKRSAY